MIVPPTERWEPIILSADCVIADQGSMSVYAAALDLALIMAGGSPETTVPGSPVAEVAAVVVDDRTCRIATPGGSAVEFSVDTAADAGRPTCDPLLLASLAWILLKNKRVSMAST